ncbi:MAG: hypothetical protein DSY47_06260 [Hydrogenothermus sp.]|nr:MAG: hypothetical protein DSY47_06260 [Hydrogenothermus sp.]
MLKIGWIDYINTYPFNFEFTNLKPNFKYLLVKGVPSQINKLLRENKIDAGCISSAEYLENKNKYILLNDLSISANNKVFSVAIFSNIEISDVETIYLSKASKSSRYLTKIFLEIFLNKKVEYKELESYENIEDKTVLLIGDNAIKFSKKFKYIYDLSKIWKENTGYPFVFAVWAIDRNFYLENKNIVCELENILKLSKKRFFSNLDFYIKKIDFDDKNFLTKYFKSLNYDLSEMHLESLKEFEEYIKRLRGI